MLGGEDRDPLNVGVSPWHPARRIRGRCSTNEKQPMKPNLSGPLILGIGMLGLAAGCQPIREATHDGSVEKPTPAQTVLVENGRAGATIVLAEHPTVTAVLAAEEINAHLEQISGARLPIVSDREQVNAARVLIGESAATRALGLKAADFRYDEHLTRVAKDTVILMGAEHEHERMSTAPGKFGQAWNCTDTSGSFDVFEDRFPGTQGTLELWFSIPEHDSNAVFKGSHNTFLSVVSPGGSLHLQAKEFGKQLAVWCGSSNHNKPIPLTPGWHHLMVTWDIASELCAVYLDGAAAGSFTYDTAISPNACLQFGNRISPFWWQSLPRIPSAAMFDEVRISDCLREPAHWTEKPVADTHTVRHLDFEQPSPAMNMYDCNLVNDRPTLHAAYEFLETSLNVRWYHPGDIGLSCKPSKTVACAPMDIRRSPHCKYRFLKMYGSEALKGSEFRVWLRRMRMEEGDRSYIALEHTFTFQAQNLRPDQREIGTEEYVTWHNQLVAEGKKAEIPAMWGLRLNGDGTLNSQNGNPCYSKQELVDKTISIARAFLDGKRQEHGLHGWGAMFGNSISLGANDCMIQCQCARCKSQYTFTPKTLEAMKYMTGGGTASDLIFGFYIKIAEALLKSHPDARVNVMAYLDYAYPPQKITTLPRNMRVTVCLYPFESWNPGATQNDRAIWREWIERFPEVQKAVVLYLDDTPPPPFPYMNVHYWLTNMRWYLNTGADSFLMYRNPAWLMPETYILARMADDPAVDENALLDEYFVHYWGAAAGPIRNIFALFEGIQNNPANFPADAFKPLTQKNFDKFGDGKILHEHLLTGERLARITAWMEEAERLAVAPEEKRRVEWFRKTILKPVLDRNR